MDEIRRMYSYTAQDIADNINEVREARSSYSSLGARIDSIVQGCIIIAKTTAEWAADPSLISQKNTVYVYTDYDTKNGVDIPGAKIGDGLAYVVDLPFVFGITKEDIESWNNKIAVRMDDVDIEKLIMYT